MEPRLTVNSTYVGTLFKPYHAMVVPRDTMNFAASIGDRNPCYFDDENEGGVVAHPMHCAAVTWPILERIHEFIGIEDFPFEILATQVHYSECLSLHRLLVPGDRLKIQGRIAAILPHRAGTHMITRLDALDETDQPVFSEHIGGLMRGVECTDKGRAEAGAPPVSPPESEPTFTWESSILIDDLMPFIYDGCTRIHFPIHTSRQFARHVGLLARRCRTMRRFTPGRSWFHSRLRCDERRPADPVGLVCYIVRPGRGKAHRPEVSNGSAQAEVGNVGRVNDPPWGAKIGATGL